MAIWRRGVFHPRVGFVGAEIFTNFWCFGNNFGYRYARKSFKGSKDADFGLVSEKSWTIIMGQYVGAHGKVKVAKNTPTCGVPPRKPPTANENFFCDIDYMTCCPQRV